MVLPDVNVLVYAHREDVPDHARYRDWLETVINGSESYGLAELVLSGFVRVATHPKVFTRPSTLPQALEFAEQLRGRPNRIAVAPGPRHWGIFCTLCAGANARGNLVPDAYLAAMAIESGCEWITTDRDFSRFKELRTRHPLQ
ncbi:MAG: type II toxin-antitoxin system VapC family toxin [Proteobacteria bacterium]|nr:type II toxin-antitoxin system VapC family toxin [Pseudomonadota bacterium]